MKKDSALTSGHEENLSVSTDIKLAERSSRYGWVVLGACVVVVAVTFGTRYSFGVFFKPLETDFGWSRAVTSGVFSVYMAICLFMAPLGGWLGDRYGPKVIAVMGGVTGIGLLLTSQATSLWYLFVSYGLLLAVGTGGTWSIAMATATKWSPQKRGLAAGIVNSGTGIGTMIMTPLSAYLIASYNWRSSFIVLALLAICTIIPGGLLLKRAPAERTTSPALEQSGATRRRVATKQLRTELEGFSLSQATKTRSFWFLFLTSLLYAICVSIVMAHIVPHAIDMGVNPLRASMLLSFVGGTTIAGNMAMGKLADSMGRKRTAVFCALVMAAAMVWLTQSTSPWMLYLFAIVFGFVYGGLTPPLSALLGDIFGLRHFGSLIGARTAAWAIGFAFGPALAGYIFDIYASYDAAFLVGMAAMLITAVLVVLIKRPAARPR